MIAVGEQRLGEGAPANVAFQVHGASDPVAGAPFGAVLAFSLLHLVPDPQATLRAVRRNPLPGGLFVSKTVCLGDRPGLLRKMVKTMTFFGKAPEVLPVTRRTLVHAIVDAGFEVIDVAHFGDQVTNPFIVARG